MIGAILGDVIGSVYEHNPIKETDFPLFQPHSRYTDDTVLTVAVAQAILERIDYGKAIKDFGRRYPGAGYAEMFRRWLRAPVSYPYHSWGNGSAMRVSPVAWAYSDEATVLAEAEKTAMISHNHPEGIKGAQAVALCIFRARKGATKEDIRLEISERFDYDLGRSLDKIRPNYKFDASCPGTVPEAVIAFLESENVEDAIRKAVSLGGDSDTLACITGSIAHAFYAFIPQENVLQARSRLPEEMLDIIDEFAERYQVPSVYPRV